ncbi:MAG: enoyl-CoA hydratase-related protein [Candidatus Dormibacteraeota bacterium]|nr:enoyl-CoA hydratase-related protein [Candidatus Dormibacteraeota bacterium]
MEYENVLAERVGRVGVVTMNRPRVLNALSPEHIADITSALAAFDADGEIGALVLTGGPGVFAAGADIADMADRSPVDQMLRDQTGRWAKIGQLTKPLIAAVNGYALGGGCELALMCDLIVAGDSARFGQPEINLGIIPGAGGTQRWPRTVGKYVAMEIALGGDPIPAPRAYQLGLVNRVVPAETTLRTAIQLGEKLAAKPALALRLAKESVNTALEVPLQDGLAFERKNFYFLFSSEDQKEGMHAFLEKRRGQFRGR